MTKRSFILSFFAVAIFALSLPVLASAQGNWDPWGNGRNNGRNNRRRDDDRYYNYNRRALKESINRVENRSDHFKDRLEDALDHSRLNGSNLEDRINELADRFQDAADDLKDAFDDGRNLNRSTDEARRLLQLGSQLDRFMYRARLDGHTEAHWSQIRRDLNVIANAYGFNFADFNDRYNDRYDDDDDNDDYFGRNNERRTWPL